ncbi:MAG: 23S rRNA (pseudouridine(1915)-N(3))-methyltransferase RlmH [Candidatus Peribacteraceae bacterium]|nr:23S rRNA (pseudouridine(1915)-N(3))-methyltransferase RlmH [Candidatus Peribacteraceae bacterium]MDD5075085.1 23S rRNA (pseudouridine(1915)-N(3))-methyltransferase RlmH [Candidatus Peribacteraceae bacterium]
MQKITLLCVGSLKTRFLAEGCAHYIERLNHAFTLEVMELSASKEKDPAKQCGEESRRLLAALEKKDGDVWVLDERGKSLTSRNFAGEMAKARDAGRPMIFVLGGAFGLSDEVRKRGNRILRLSDMTFPHELCRLVFLEQLYRASEIGKGSGYHH